MKDAEIGRLAGVSRAVVNSVMNGKYRCNHRLSYNGGARIINKLQELKANGYLPNFNLDRLGTSQASTLRPGSE